VAGSKLVNSLKGVSSRRLAQKYGGPHRCFWTGVLWSPSYCAGSVGGAPIAVLRQYSTPVFFAGIKSSKNLRSSLTLNGGASAAAWSNEANLQTLFCKIQDFYNW
jgi:putative transposase